MRLSAFIRQNRPVIIQEWEAFARGLRPAAGMTDLQLTDHIDKILTFIADDIETEQTALEQSEKAQGRQVERNPGVDTAAQTHAALRHTDGFDIVEMVSEYRALRASVTRLWAAQREVMSADDVRDLGRFNEAIDQALAESVVRFTGSVEKAKDVLLGVLGHDIRGPVAAVQMAASMVERLGPVNTEQRQMLDQVSLSADRVQLIVRDLIDLAKSKAGQSLPLKKSRCSLTTLCNHIVDETKVRNPDREIYVVLPGYIEGHWDEIRIGQMLTNLLSNAVQYGEPSMPIVLNVSDYDCDVVIAVTNGGEPIPPTHLDTIFKSFARVPSKEPQGEVPTSNLGLGLFICKEIATAHGGTISVVSGKREGTTFSVRLPKSNNGMTMTCLPSIPQS